MASEVVLGSGLRTNLLSLQRTQSQIDKVQNILSTGYKVASALDNPQSYFASQSLRASSATLLALVDAVGQSIQTVKTADAGVTAIKSLLEQADSIVQSARETLTTGEVKASITGDVDLSGVSDVTSILGISDTDDIYFDYYDTNGVLQTASVNIATGDSASQLITKIEDIGGGGFFNAELTSQGYLKITEIRGNSFNVNFTADNNADASDPADSQLASALGFGNQITATTRNGGAAANANAELTVLASTRLVSGAFYETGGAANGYLEASDLLTDAVDSSGGSNARFAVGSAGDGLNLTFKVNGSVTSSTINLEGLTVQGLVDAVNTDTNVSAYIEASYDSSTGQFIIEAKSADVETINVTVEDPVTGGAGTPEADFDFGTDTGFLPGNTAADAEGETYFLASASGTLESLQSDYNSIREQIDTLAADAGYRGTNLLASDFLDTYFNQARTNKLRIDGSDLASSGLGLSAANFSTTTTIADAEAEIAAALDAVESFGSSISNGLSIIQTRESFINSYIEALDEGADKLTVADQNEEGAKLLALQTRLQLGVSALSLASQAQQSVLRLFAS